MAHNGHEHIEQKYKVIFTAIKYGKEIFGSVKHLHAALEFWIAWKATRIVAEAFIAKAKELKLSDEQVEEFRKLAREVAPE